MVWIVVNKTDLCYGLRVTRRHAWSMARPPIVTVTLITDVVLSVERMCSGQLAYGNYRYHTFLEMSV